LHPDAELLSSPGGAQAIIGRDFWDHEQDVALDEMPIDRFELPAFEVRVYEDRQHPAHQVYSLAGVQAVARVPVGFDYNAAASQGGGGDTSNGGLPDVLGPNTADANGQHYVPGRNGVPASSNKPAGVVGAINGALRGAGELLKSISEALGLALVSPFSSPGLLLSFGFLGSPVYLASRRRLLLTRRNEVSEA